MHRRMLSSLLLSLLLTASGCASQAPVAPSVTPTSLTVPTATATLAPSPTPSTPATPSLTSSATAPSSPPLPDSLRPVVAVDELLPGTFLALEAAPDGGVWLITDQGVGRWSGQAWSTYLAEFTGQWVGVDAAGRVWVTSEDTRQISAWDGAAWTAYGAAEGWAPVADEGSREIQAGGTDGNGRFWVATSADIRLFDGERWRVLEPRTILMREIGPEDLVPKFVLSAVPEDTVVWVGECDWGGPGPFGGQGVRWQDQIWNGNASPVDSGCATAIARGTGADVWVGLESNLWHYDPATRWTQFAPPAPPEPYARFGFATEITVDRQGDPWPVMALCGGASCFTGAVLYHFADGEWIQIAASEEAALHAPVFDGAGTGWFFWDGAIYRLQGDVPAPFVEMPMADPTVDVSGQVWFVAPYQERDTVFVIAGGGR